jgi:mono/diheme cytochrome c family protein
MKKTNQLFVFLMIMIVLLLAACGPAMEAGIPAPTARPYTAMELPPPYGESAPVVGDKDNGQVLYQQYCGECHTTEENGKSAAPSLFGAGSRLSYDQVKESIIYPKAHDAYLEAELHAVDVNMPSDFGGLLTIQQIEDLITFIRSQ